MKPNHIILIVNPGSTSTKLAISIDDMVECSETIHHSVEDLSQFCHIWDQLPYRLDLCLKWVHGKLKKCDAVASIGGLFRPLEAGTYRVTKRMLQDAHRNVQGEHASNLGCVLAYELANRYQCPAFVVDPISVDEFEPLSRYSGHPLIQRRSLSHALNIHAAARKAAEELGIPLVQSSFVIAHLGGGISIAPVKGGKIIDVNDAASDGPFSPERTGGLPLQQFLSLCFSGSYTERRLRSLVMDKGGLVAYLGMNSVVEVENRIANGDTTAREVLEAMAYQIAKEIGAMATVLKGRIDAIVLTGGISRSKLLASWIEERVGFIAPLILFPCEDEMRALAEGVLRVLKDEEQAKEY